MGKNAFAVMHNCCTTALEAIVLKKPVVTYILSGQKYSPQLANELGYRVKSLEELLSKLILYLSLARLNKIKIR